MIIWQYMQIGMGVTLGVAAAGVALMLAAAGCDLLGDWWLRARIRRAARRGKHAGQG